MTALSAVSSNIYNIPAGAPFAKTLAAYVVEEAERRSITLPDIRILLPTRRACRTMREAFLQITEGKPLLLPRLQPLGDIDEEELSFTLTGDIDLKEQLAMPPAIAPLKRRLLLARLINGHELFHAGFDQALKLAEALGQFMDHIYTENLDMGDLINLVPESFAGHWQITLDFLKILSEHWPKILKENGVIDAADRRNRLLNILAEHWQRTQPKGWIIAAGSTGSIPAVANLLSIIANLPLGQVVLPGLDKDMEESDWEALEASHPQYNLREILKITGTQRIAVFDLPARSQNDPNMKQNRFLTTQIMRPAATSEQWLSLKSDDIQNALTRISLYECENSQEEAGIIALIMRETLGIENSAKTETKDSELILKNADNPPAKSTLKTCALITPDRELAMRVKTACTRWGITVDDSAGQPLIAISLGRYLLLSYDTLRSNLSPARLLAFLKHPYSRAGMPRQNYREAVSLLEIKALRGLRPAPGINGLKARVNEVFEDNIPENLATLLRVIEEQMAPLADLLNSTNDLNPKEIIEDHLGFCENWTRAVAEEETPSLWQGEAGEEAAKFYAELLDHVHLMPPASAAAIGDVQRTLLSRINIRPAYGTHPRLMILGQLEARLIDADTVILAGLNEGSWPADPAHDPWMSRPMREDFGLPAPERSIGLAAHDFVQGLCAPRVILTRSKRGGGTPTVPARWLQRLDIVMKAAGIAPETIRQRRYKDYLAHLAKVMDVTPTHRPAPCPPVEARPQRLSVTRIEQWLKDPYSIYAQYVLRLHALEPLEKQPDAKEKGTLLHDILERFITENPRELPVDTIGALKTIAAEELEKLNEDPAIWHFWWPRFNRIAAWIAEQEITWRQEGSPFKTEVKGTYSFDVATEGIPPTTFTLSAIADRIDRLKSGGVAIIDYKSGGQYSLSGFANGRQPQLPLEALIALKGGFEDMPAQDVGSIGYWKLTGGNPAGEDKTKLEGSDIITEIAEEALEKLTQLVAAFQNDKTPYLSLPRPQNLPRFNDYELLARVKEWTALDDSDDIGEVA